MTIRFKNMGSSGMDLIKDSTGIVWISITDSTFTQQMPLSNTDINNLIATLEYLKRLQPENLREDSFPSANLTTNGYIDDMRERGYTLVSTSGDITTQINSTITDLKNVHAYNNTAAMQSLSDIEIPTQPGSLADAYNNLNTIKNNIAKQPTKILTKL